MSVLDQAGTWPVPHAAVAVVTPEGVADTFGEVDLVQPIASVTKLLVSYAVMVAVEEEALTLDDPAGPEGSTVRHLLSHTAGYGFESGADVISPVGARRIYSNAGFEVLAAHLESVTGIAMPVYLHEAVLVPLGMASTVLEGSAGAGVRSTVTDLAAFARECLAPTLVAPATWTCWVDVAFPGLPGVMPGHGRYPVLDWGLGVERNFTRPGHWGGTRVSPQTFGHFGAAGSFLWADPVHAVGAVCLTGEDFEQWAKDAWPAFNDDVVAAYGRGGK